MDLAASEISISGALLMLTPDQMTAAEGVPFAARSTALQREVYETAVVVDPRELHILQHALGVDQYGRGDQYRSHFVTGDGSDDHPACMSLVAAGLMRRHAGSEMTGGDDLFRVTEAGRAYVAEHSPPPPKLTRSQQRYSDYLDADSDMSFGEWLRWQSRKARGETANG